VLPDIYIFSVGIKPRALLILCKCSTTRLNHWAFDDTFF
jgi:hypothetical protein